MDKLSQEGPHLCLPECLSFASVFVITDVDFSWFSSLTPVDSFSVVSGDQIKTFKDPDLVWEGKTKRKQGNERRNTADGFSGIHLFSFYIYQPPCQERAHGELPARTGSPLLSPITFALSIQSPGFIFSSVVLLYSYGLCAE